MKYLIGAGGTGGHIIPALAVAQELCCRGHEVCFVGNKGSMEEALVTNRSYRFLSINVQKLYRGFTIKHLKFPFLLLKSIVECIIYIKSEKPVCVFVTGGFVSGPLAIAAKIQRKPLFIQDGNSYPGLTTRISARYSHKIFIASEDAVSYLPANKCILTGNPILIKNMNERKDIDWNQSTLSKDTIKVLVLGGSQGSVIINKTFEQCINELRQMDIEIIWQAGKPYYFSHKEKYSQQTGIVMFDFTERIAGYYAMADVAITRAGALTIAELSEFRIPSVLIPLPTSAENHQFKNALAHVHKGGGILLPQSELTPESLLKALRRIVSELSEFKARMEAIPHNEATAKICNVMENDLQNLGSSNVR